MISSNFENDHVEVLMTADNISGDDVLQAAEEVVIVEEMIALEVGAIMVGDSEVVDIPGEGVMESVTEIEEGEITDSDSDMANYSIASETYDETLDLGYGATNIFSPLVRAGTQGQLHRPRSPSLQVDRQSTSLTSPHRNLVTGSLVELNMEEIIKE